MTFSRRPVKKEKKEKTRYFLAVACKNPDFGKKLLPTAIKGGNGKIFTIPNHIRDNLNKTRICTSLV